MSTHFNHFLYSKLKQKGFLPNYVVEVGVWHPETSNIYLYIKDNIKTMLVEPNPKSITLIKEQLNIPSVILHEVALCDFEGSVELCQRESSTFISDLPNSPAIENDNCDIESSEKFTAKAIKFSAIDNGKIDLISIDTEGSEWFVIKNMISRPSVISIETHGGTYINPYIDELKLWMSDNKYQLFFKDKSDSVYTLKNTIHISLMDKINIFVNEVIIRSRSVRKKITRKFKG